MDKCVFDAKLDISKYKNLLSFARGNLEMQIDGEHDTVSV